MALTPGSPKTMFSVGHSPGVRFAAAGGRAGAGLERCKYLHVILPATSDHNPVCFDREALPASWD